MLSPVQRVWSRRTRVAASFVVTVLSLSLVSCAQLPRRRWIPSELITASDYYLVSRSTGPSAGAVRFGPYQVAAAQLGIPEGSEKQPSMLNGQLGRATSRQDGWFKLQTPSGARQGVYCAQDRRADRQYNKKLTFDDKGVRIVQEVTHEQLTFSYRCLLEQAQSAAAPSLAMTRSGGTVRVGDRKLALRPLRRADGHEKARPDGTATGYLLVDDGVEVAAVDLTEGQEAVLLRESLPQAQKDLLAALCMALLFRLDMA